MFHNSILCPCINTTQLLGLDPHIVNNNMEFKSLLASQGLPLQESATSITFSTNFRHNNTVFVDGQFGNDATALRESIVMPFRTILAAISASLTGDVIYVRAGTFANVQITQIGRIYYFEPGCVLRNFSFIGQHTILGFGDFRQTNTQLFNGRGIFFSRRIIDNSIFNTFECTNATYINAEYIRKRNLGTLFLSTSGSSSAKIQWVTCSTACANGNFNLEIDRLFLSGSDNCFIGAINLRSNKMQYNGSGTLFSSGNIQCIIDNLTCRGYFSDTRGRLFVQSSRITFTTNLGANSVIICRSNGQIFITAHEIRYRIPNVMDFINCAGQLTITGKLIGLATPQINNFAVGNGVINLNCTDLNIWGTFNSGNEININSNKIIINIGSSIIINNGVFNINTNTLENFGIPILINGGNTNINIKYVQLFNIFANIFGGQNRISIDNLNSNFTVLLINGNCTCQFGGIWTTTSPHLIENQSSSSNITLLPSKLVSNGPFFNSLSLVNIYSISSITKFGGIGTTIIGNLIVDLLVI